MKCLFIIQGLRSGGAERVISVLCNEFAKRDHEILLALTETSDKRAYDIDSKVKIIDLSNVTGGVFRRRLQQIVRLRRVYKFEKPDVAISFITRTNVCAIIAGLFLKQRIVVSERNNPQTDPPGKISKLVRDIVYPLADGLVFQTEFARGCFRGIVQKKGVVIENPVSDTVLEYRNNNIRKKRIISVCRLEKQKNIPMLVNAFYRVSNQHTDYCLDIFGEGSLDKIIQNQIDSLQMNEKIILRGFTSESIREMSESEIFVLSSDYEGMPNSLIEAMCVGCACITTDSPAYGAREIINNDYNGILIPVGDEECLVKALRELLGNKDKINLYSANAKKVYSRFERKKVVDRWEEYLEEVTRKYVKGGKSQK